MKNMKNHLSVIEQNPVAFPFTLNTIVTNSPLPKRLSHPVSNPTAVKMGTSFTDKKHICQERLPLQINPAEPEGLDGLELFDEELRKLNRAKPGVPFLNGIGFLGIEGTVQVQKQAPLGRLRAVGKESVSLFCDLFDR